VVGLALGHAVEDQELALGQVSRPRIRFSADIRVTTSWLPKGLMTNNRQ